MTNSPLRIIQISDTHLYEDKGRSLLGVNTEESFQAVIALLEKEAEKYDFIFHNGDLSQDGSEASYLRIAKAFKKFNVPIYFIPGNHDNVKVMSQIYPRDNLSSHRHIVLKNWHFILLNSQVPGQVYGHLDASQLTYLKHCLQAYPEHQAIIALHHQPMPVSCKWLDGSKLDNPEAFWDVLASYPKVNTVLFGHVHQAHDLIVNQVKCISAPATCFQFKLNHDAFALDNIPQGYRCLTLHDDGRVETEVRRLAKYIGSFDAKATGY